jgi:glyoxylase I family protein
MTSKNSKIEGCSFHHVAMKVKDFDGVVRFYVQGLGFRETKRWGEGDGRAVMLDCGDGSCIEVFAGGAAGSVPEGAWLHYALSVKNCDASLAAALAAGAVQTMPPTTLDVPSTPAPFRVRIAFCRGLGGETIEFMQPL